MAKIRTIYLSCRKCKISKAITGKHIALSLAEDLFKVEHEDCEGGENMRQSARFTLNAEDLKKWGFNIVRFVLIPTVIAFLTALQGGIDMQVAWGVALGTGYTSVVDLVRKFLADK